MNTDKAIAWLNTNKQYKSIVFFEYSQAQVDGGKRPTQKRKITRHTNPKSKNQTYLVTIGRLSYSETKFIKKFFAEYGVWPADASIKVPKKRSSN